MTSSKGGVLRALVVSALGEAQADAALDILAISPALSEQTGGAVSRAAMAMALNVALFSDLLGRAPTAAAYIADLKRAGRKAVFDHGALRTIRFPDGPTGALPPGQESITRILEPLGYGLAGVYPLDQIGMTGRAYAQQDMPEEVPQFFVSELHIERFSPAFQETARRVFETAVDPLGPAALKALRAFAETGSAPLALAQEALPQFVAAFDRHHDIPELADYEALLEESKEAAWISTEGSAFNHATDRVEDVDALAEDQRAMGRPIKDKMEVSRNGRVRQTAFRADPVVRLFRIPEGEMSRSVPGSFYEFITRAKLDDGSGRLDLTFDSGNAQGIFKMTRPT